MQHYNDVVIDVTCWKVIGLVPLTSSVSIPGP